MDESSLRFLRDIKGSEDRFLVGSDFYVFGLDEGCRVEEQNGMKVAFCKFAEDYKVETPEADAVFLLSDYSLGDFITEGEDSEGIIVGIYLTKDERTVFEFPINIIDGYPVLFSPKSGEISVVN